MAAAKETAATERDMLVASLEATKTTQAQLEDQLASASDEIAQLTTAVTAMSSAANASKKEHDLAMQSALRDVERLQKEVTEIKSKSASELERLTEELSARKAAELSAAMDVATKAHQAQVAALTEAHEKAREAAAATIQDLEARISLSQVPFFQVCLTFRRSRRTPAWPQCAQALNRFWLLTLVWRPISRTHNQARRS
jgi:chromosome segregation ATPase